MSTGSGPTPPSPDKIPRTERGRKTLRKLLDAAALEFGERGFHDASITGITRRAGVALGTFYTYFDSKDEVFHALVRDLSGLVRDAARHALEGEHDAIGTERAALAAFLAFAREHKEIYRIIDEAEFVDPASFRSHYETTALRIHERLQRGAQSGELRADVSEAHAWAIMGMNVFLGLRYAVWSEDLEPDEIAGIASDLLDRGLASR
ncbi:TetR family transcriptional regulator [Novosphingobium sp. PC22D]|uniref:TetR/AcrR family transcriptional regulator n=1 Tax=Novosphingobium sp. PC22D TaxID=1962403 RepID=UPI000BEFFB5E|nr:TetR/AcrR family transcriptional regulator [Novosphingobium sp. PC22D]PEQ13818.1 TetR family transcriptional regulator [Novosphingobium sp. PC22D]